MASHGSDENGLYWEDGHIACHELFTVTSETVAEFSHFYAYGFCKRKFLTESLGRIIPNLKTLIAKTAHSLYEWLMYHLQTIS